MNSQNEEQKQQQKAKELPPPPPPLSEVDQERARLQEELKRRLIVKDTAPWADDISSCRYMAGLDVSYEKDDSPPGSATRCAAALVILDTEDWSLVYQDVLFGEARAQYAAGFLAFREIDLLLALVERLKAAAAAAQSQRESSKSSPNSSPPPPPPPPTPDVWLIDGNGVMHPRGLGLASHFGVLVDQPTVGVSKNPYFFDDSHFEGGEGGRGGRVDRVAFKQQLARRLLKRGDCLPITNGADGSSTVVGVALKVQDAVAGPVYVSVGHRVSLETAIAVVLRCSRRYKNPEPLRQADMISRQALRKRKEKEEKEEKEELMRMNKNVTDLKALRLS